MRKYSTLSENELLHCLQRGDEKAFTEVYNRYWQKLLAVGYAYSHDKQEAEDIVHEVLMRLWIRKHELAINSLEAYLFTAVKFSVFKSVMRNKRRRELLAKSFTVESPTDIEGKLEAHFLKEFMQGQIENLPQKAKLVFRYSRHDELTIEEIAGKMDLTPKAVEYHMTKALRSLREALKKIKSFFV